MWNTAGTRFFAEWRCLGGNKTFPSNANLDDNAVGAVVGFPIFTETAL